MTDARNKRRGIDGRKAQSLFDHLWSWRAVADVMKRDDGSSYTTAALARAAWLWRTTAGVNSRFVRAEYDAGELGTWWRPSPPLAVRMVPDYRTDTISKMEGKP